MPALQALGPHLAAPAAAASGSSPCLRPAGVTPLRRSPASLGRASSSSSSRGCKLLRIAAVAGGPQRGGSPPPPGLPDPAALEALRTPASKARRNQILSRIDGLIEEELKSSLPLPSVDELVGDDFRESERKTQRHVFDFELWRRHRSSGRYARHMVGLFESTTVRWIAAPLAYALGLTAAFGAYSTAAEAGLVPAVYEGLKSGQALSLMSAALSTTLVLRTNTSYQRFDEARKMWGLVVNRSRDFTRQGLAYIPDDQPQLQDMFCRWMVAYNRSLMCHLRPGEDLYQEMAPRLAPAELEALMAASHRPNYVCQVLTAILDAAKLPGRQVDPLDSFANVKASALVRMDENLTVFADVTGGCERILRTPVPKLYTRLNSRMLVFWLTLLPFSLWDKLHWTALPVVAIAAFLLLGVEEIGVQIEEPFTILPLERIADTIETNVWELHRAHSTEAAASQRTRNWEDPLPGENEQVDADSLVAVIARRW